MASSPITTSSSPAFTAMEPFTLTPSAAGTDITTILHDEDPKGAMIQATALEVDGLMQTFMETLGSHNEEIEVLNGTISSQAKTIDQLQTDLVKLKSQRQEMLLFYQAKIDTLTACMANMIAQVTTANEMIANRCKDIDERQFHQRMCEQAAEITYQMSWDISAGSARLGGPDPLGVFPGGTERQRLACYLKILPQKYHSRLSGCDVLKVFGSESSTDAQAINERFEAVMKEAEGFNHLLQAVAKDSEKLKEKFDADE